MAKKDAYDRNEDLDLLDVDGFTPVYNINNTFWDTIEKTVPKNTMKFVRFVILQKKINASTNTIVHRRKHAERLISLNGR